MEIVTRLKNNFKKIVYDAKTSYTIFVYIYCEREQTPDFANTVNNLDL